MQLAAVVTMVRDDAFFLRAWLRHYGEMFGRENCYIINHGRGTEVAELAAGCNVIGIPGDPHKNFDVKRWGLLNNLTGGLRRYYRHVIVGDVDELVVVDPEEGKTLKEWLEGAPEDRVFTPVGLEVLHRIDLEHDSAEDMILGPRRHVRLAPHYSKPCIVSAPTKIARGGHFTQYGKLHAPDFLYLMHLKFADFGAYVEAMDRRNGVTSDIGAGIKDTAIGRHWFAEARGEDRAVFEAFADMPMEEGFDVGYVRKRMNRSFGPRGTTGYYEFARPDYKVQYQLPERFNGIF
ncbi:MAG: glycosyltransferase family 2 protein [Pseudomonadota bacterium]